MRSFFLQNRKIREMEILTFCVVNFEPIKFKNNVRRRVAVVPPPLVDVRGDEGCYRPLVGI